MTDQEFIDLLAQFVREKNADILVHTQDGYDIEIKRVYKKSTDKYSEDDDDLVTTCCIGACAAAIF